MKITRQDVLHVADLAHLELSESEVETYLSQLDHILSYVDKLNQVDTAQVEPMAQASSGAGADGGKGEPAAESSSWRDDSVQVCDVAAEALAVAPDSAKPYFRVPKVIER